MSVNVLSGAETLLVNTDTLATSALTQPTRAVLPNVDDGAGATLAVGAEVRFQATGGSPIEVLTRDLRRVGIVPGRGEAVVVARAGVAESETDDFAFEILTQTPAAFQSITATYVQAESVAMRDALVNAGLMLAE